MDGYLSSASWKQLTVDYGIRPGEPPANSVRTIALSQLQDEAACHEYISWFRDYIGAPDTLVAASMLAKRIGYLWIVPLLTAMTFHNREVLCQMDKSFLYHPDLSAGQGGTRFPFLALEGLRTTAAPPDNRAVWREKVVREVFAARLGPLLQTLSAAGPVSMAILWENIMVRIAPLYAAGKEDSGQDKQQMSEDFTYLTGTAPGHLFNMRRNPFTRFTENNGLVQVARSKRSTCCFYYRMSGEYCVKCPKIDNENESQLK
ncbi:ferric iron reductase [Paenibacillus sp. FSL R7-0273]|uniref:(2Fe-2S)-binding protein n=1 Tax=Paenibacillus sp. FSL R7-0273 TaxID=1536772 RepID=UPI0004F6BF10|nr:IucA/IucC family C-terminal-domain containing protein [Paenibacillus sp. FSL R7-0273]AIQ47950.1 ferric iron reductase [Paenibacillus sp. FSL R7-0273]OMF94499.1 ferric iron reductase [Paenibacillus sp. FSL R7-0273]